MSASYVRAAAHYVLTLALVGWYLMLPPVRPDSVGEPEPDTAAPIARWDIVVTFDTAEECNVVQSEHSRITFPDGTPDHVLRAVRCIATDDPRLIPPANR
jgi:hypothetical protein